MQSFTRRSWKLKLSGRDNQQIRYLIHTCQRSVVAINECPQPLLDQLLALASDHPSILSGLLAWSARLRVSSGNDTSNHHHHHHHHHRPQPSPQQATPEDSSPSSLNGEALGRHQETVSKMRSMLSRLQPPHDNASDGDVFEALGSCMLLAVFGFPEQAHNWSVHVAGMIALVDSLDMARLGSVPLVRYVRTIAAHMDITAFALNRPEPSQNKWLNWDICPLETNRWDGTATFTPFEVSTGYPESLVTVIALLSAVVEDTNHADTVVDLSVAEYMQNVCVKMQISNWNGSPEWNSGFFDTSSPQDPSGAQYWTWRMHAIIASWDPPEISPRLSSTLSLALTTAWEIIRKAAHIYLARGGFATPISSHIHGRSPRVPTGAGQRNTIRKYIREIIVGLQHLTSLAEEQGITIANAMIWPLTVVGAEIFDDPPLQRELVALFHRLLAYFRIAHLSQILDLLSELWRRYAEITTAYSSAALSTLLHLSPGNTASASDLTQLSLASLAAERYLSIPLF
ncbi:fungal-specific transcription factor domain-containing protein [Aspergillus heterothallicus]